MFALFMLTGLFASVWATCSCNLIAIEYNKGGVHLSITAVGFFGYQRNGVDPTHNNDRDLRGNRGVYEMKKQVCADYGKTQHMEVDLRHFFPTNHTLQMYSIVGPSFYFAGIFSIILFLFILVMHPEVLAQSETIEYPPKGITTTITMAAVCLLASGIFQVYSVHGLMHFSDNESNDRSPICNPAYSSCHLGKGGKWAAFSIFCAFFCGFMMCFGAYFVASRAGRTTRCCGR
mmetsp:Transcript_15540/g.32884  ORF Transcript_15540/g.32884 Transcript_15540/m.32884 type:complete len:232 (-) Transcript_15540:1156-1851(-)